MQQPFICPLTPQTVATAASGLHPPCIKVHQRRHALKKYAAQETAIYRQALHVSNKGLRYMSTLPRYFRQNLEF